MPVENLGFDLLPKHILKEMAEIRLDVRRQNWI